MQTQPWTRAEAMAIMEFEPGDNPSPEEVRKKFKELARKYHPDVNQNQDTKFKEVHQAFNRLVTLGQVPKLSVETVADIVFGRSNIIKKARNGSVR
ncbi:MAG: hypothetical protein COX52_10390 [Syntrophobacterales bacterium CG23_combo_of_CG06-09_8_20_14_all_48_27]|nr:MAG: hypothetical protein COX52_10390 [Syntrophobacterales bacterium CG23_combo_of_CG06-09_8_20_14_all_48_27]